MRRTTILVLVVIGLIAVSLTVHGQSVIDLYGKKGLAPEQRDAVTAFQVARHLFDGTNWNDQQRLFLEQLIVNPRSAKAMQDAPLTLFTADQIRDIFYTFNADLSKFRSVLQLSSFKDEQQFMVSQTDTVRAGLWRDHFAANASRLNYHQLEFVYRIGQWLNNPRDKKAGLALLKESRGKFDPELGHSLLGQIGTHPATCGATTAGYIAPLMSDCVCSVGSSFNWSCSGSCNSGNGTCSETSDGCGFLGWYPCGGNCKPGEEQ
jgi:hypothetical protein